MPLTHRLFFLFTVLSAACLAQSISTLPTVDCVFSPSSNCTPLLVSGDPYSTTGAFTGYADPSIRKDPNSTGMIWMAYSWPTVTTNMTKPIDIHLAYNNAGAGWTNAGLANYVLYGSTTVSNGVTGATDDQTASEVISLAMQNVNGTTYVYQAHLSYQIATGQVGPLGQPYTARLMVSGCAFASTAQGPDCLLNATPQYLGGSAINTTYWPISQNLTTLSGSSCSKFGEPTVIMNGTTLLLNVVCLDDYSNYYQFAANDANSNLGNWTWTYVGTWGSKTDADSICSYFNACSESLFFNACELASSAYIGYLAVCNVDYNVSNQINQVLGSVALAMGTLSPPSLSHVSGAPQVLAYMTCSGCTAHGPGAPAYEPEYDGGMISALVLTDCAAGSAGCVSTPGFKGEFTQLASTGLPGTKPTINTGGVINAASYIAGSVAPGSIASVFGTFLPNALALADTATLPVSLSGFSMEFDGQYPVPLYYVGGGQVNIEIPWELEGQSSATLTATYNGQTSAAQTIGIASFAPGIFTTNSAGTGQGAILDESYHLVNSANPATPGSTTLQIFCTGLGAVTNQPQTGSPAPSNPLSYSMNPPSVSVGGIAAKVIFSGLAPGYIGLYQVNAEVPDGVASGDAIPVVISMNGINSNTVTIAVQ